MVEIANDTCSECRSNPIYFDIYEGTRFLCYDCDVADALRANKSGQEE